MGFPHLKQHWVNHFSIENKIGRERKTSAEIVGHNTLIHFIFKWIDKKKLFLFVHHPNY